MPFKRTLKRNVTGAAIRRLRIAAKPRLTQWAIARRLSEWGVTLTQSQIAKIENGERLVADFELEALAKVLGVSVQDLFAVIAVTPQSADRGDALPDGGPC